MIVGRCSAARAVGRVADALPAADDLRRAVGLVAHTFSTPIGDVWEFELRDLAAWTREASDLHRRMAAPSASARRRR